MSDEMLASHAAGQTTYVLASWVFLRLLGLIYLAAFVSLATQIKGLVGHRGILPATEFLSAHAGAGPGRFFRRPTVCWLNASDSFLLSLCWGGAGLALLLTIGLAPALCAFLLWVSYLSLFTVCRIFLGYQWDTLLLETGFLAIFVAPPDWVPRLPPAAAPSPVILGLFWWLLFRLMFFSGAVKLRSGDRAWRNLTALCFHYQTQPLPTSPAWHACQLPARFHKLSTATMLLIELVAPFLIFGPPPCRYVAAALFIALMLLIQATGNYCFFNMLGIALSVLLLDDRLLAPLAHWVFPTLSSPLQVIVAPPVLTWVSVAIALVIAPRSLELIVRLFRLEINWPKPLRRFFELLEPFHLVNSYGLFAVMTTERPEIMIEGSQDGADWRAYEFRWKPGDVKRPPRFVAPHQPRLDWQMWFAALSYYPNHPWFKHLLARLLEGSPPVLALLKHNPFPDRPPRYVRAVLYDYRFTTRAERRATGAWWKREWRGAYCPIMTGEGDAG